MPEPDTYEKIQEEIKEFLLDNPDESPFVDFLNEVRKGFINLLVKLNIMYYEEKE